MVLAYLKARSSIHLALPLRPRPQHHSSVAAKSPSPSYTAHLQSKGEWWCCFDKRIRWKAYNHGETIPLFSVVLNTKAPRSIARTQRRLAVSELTEGRLSLPLRLIDVDLPVIP